MRIPAIVYVLALGAFALITTELGVIGILPQVSEAFGITIDRAGWLLSGFALVIALLGPWMTSVFESKQEVQSLLRSVCIFHRECCFSFRAKLRYFAANENSSCLRPSGFLVDGDVGCGGLGRAEEIVQGGFYRFHRV